jgi:methionyl aminopeptidase
LSQNNLGALREAGRVAAAARAFGASKVVAGARLAEVCAAVEDFIRERGAHLAFPTQTSRNEIAAHYCPAPDEDTVYADGDLAKLDVGVHVDGWVVDTALTVNVGDRAENRRLVEAAEAALEAAIAASGPAVPIRRLSSAIEAALRGFRVRPMQNLCGHHVGRWSVHSPPPIPNRPDDGEDRLAVGATLAIEPFATEGMGLVGEVGAPEVFRLIPGPSPTEVEGVTRAVSEALLERNGLPFSRRDLRGCPRTEVESALELLARRGRLHAYAPLVETSGRKVAQAEHTLYVGQDGVEVLTR